MAFAGIRANFSPELCRTPRSFQGNKHYLATRSLIFVSSLLFLLPLHVPKKLAYAGSLQDQITIPQSMDFPVGNRPEALLFDGSSVWVANQQSDSLMKLRASDGLNLGTFETGIRPVALTYDGTHVGVANKMSNNVMKFLAKDGSLVATIAVGQQPEALAFDGKDVWVANGRENTVTKLRLSDGASCTFKSA
jgi:hypothetical protein